MTGFMLIALNGIALGLASTLHCAGMCGAISCSLMLAQERSGVRSAQAAFALTHLGRIIAYATAGAVVGWAGAPAIALLDREAAFRLLQWAGAASIIWVGLSTAGMVPSITILDRGFASLSASIGRAGATLPRSEFAPIAAGMAWGMMPCAMVYAALFTAMLTGSGGMRCDHHGGVRGRHAPGTGRSQLWLSASLHHPRTGAFRSRLGDRGVRHRDRFSRASYCRAAVPYRQPAGNDRARHSGTASG